MILLRKASYYEKMAFISTRLIMIAIGIIYKFAFEYIEAEVRVLGLNAIITGVVSILLSPLYQNKYIKHFAILGYGFIALVQLVPISLWFMRGCETKDRKR